MRKRDFNACKWAQGYAGQFGGCEIFWADTGDWLIYDRRGALVDCPQGWYIRVGEDDLGPYKTSQHAFCDLKLAIDYVLQEEQ